MDSKPLVSIVTPLYNQSRYVEDTIKSVLDQTYEHIEYIVVNDGSTDGSSEIIEKYRGKITIIEQHNSGQATALNNGWTAATGEIFSYLSADDLLLPDCIKTLVEALQNDIGAVCAYPNCNLISDRSIELKRGVAQRFDLEQLLVEQECYIGPGPLWRAAAHRDIGGWKPELKLAPDREFWIRLSSHGRFLFIDRTLASYRLHSESTSYKVTSEIVSLEYVKVLDEYYNSAKESDPGYHRKAEAYAHAYLLIARNLLREWKIPRTMHYLKLAHKTFPKSISIHSMAILLRSALGKPVRLAIKFFAGREK